MSETQSDPPDGVESPEAPTATPDREQPADAVGDDSAQNNPGVGETGADGGQDEAESGAYVPHRATSPPSAAPAARTGASDRPGPSAAERSADRIKSAQSGQAARDADGPTELDQGRDPAVVDPIDAQQIENKSRFYVTQGIRNTSGSVTFGDHSPAMTQTTIVSVGSREIILLRGTYSPEQLRQFRDPYFRVDGFDQLAGMLALQHLVVLQGPPGTGRQSTGINLLVGLDDVDHVGMLDFDRDVALSDIFKKVELMPRHGYVLEVEVPLRRGTLTAFSALARSSEAYLVILTPPESELLEPFAFVHQAAPPLDVLRNQLIAALRLEVCEEGCTENSRAEYAATRLAEIAALPGYSLPTRGWEIVQLAHRVAAAVHEAVTTDVLVKRDPLLLRKIAVEALTIEDPGIVEASRLQGFRISYAVFNEYSLADVMKAGELFSQVLPFFETREKPPDHVVFEGRIEKLLGPRMVLGGPGGPVGVVTGAPRRAVLVDPALTGMFLDVLWNDFDALRKPVLAWLDLLVTSSDSPAVQIRTAHAAGLLATFDFGEVYRLLIGYWARGVLSQRQAAAHALQIAMMDRSLVPRIRRQVDDWAHSPNPRLQDSAARAYGQLFAETDPAAAISSLRMLAGRPDLAGSNSIALSMTKVFAHQPHDVVRELAGWNSSPDENLRRHCSRALLLLTRFAGSNFDQTQSMHAVTFDSDDLLKPLAKMWADALVSMDTGRGAWEPLRKWIIMADSDASLAAGVEKLARLILLDTDERAVFHLVAWRHRYPGSEIIRRLYDAVAPGAHRRRNAY